MRFLLDTHTVLWYGLDDPQLSMVAHQLIVHPTHQIHVSPATFWEVAIKVSIGKLQLHMPFEDFLDGCLNTYRFMLLPIQPAHLVRLASLGFPTSHKDPFDRLIAAQALADGLTLVSVDAVFDVYGVNRMW